MLQGAVCPKARDNSLFGHSGSSQGDNFVLEQPPGNLINAIEHDIDIQSKRKSADTK